MTRGIQFSKVDFLCAKITVIEGYPKDSLMVMFINIWIKPNNLKIVACFAFVIKTIAYSQNTISS